MYTDATGNMQYEWFYLDGIGSYLTNDMENVYRYWSGTLPTSGTYGIEIKEGNNEEIVKGTVNTNGNYSYSLENGIKYLCYTNGEKAAKNGATFYPAKYLCVINDVLYFGTESGDVFVFNTDKRG
jgi:hypothetical protein